MAASPPPGSPYPPQGPTYGPPTQPTPYPPQYPYAVPPSPPPRESHTALIVVLVIVVVLVVAGAVAWFAFVALMQPTQQFTRVTITTASWTVTYKGSATGYFGTPGVTYPTTPMLVGTPFSVTIALTNSGAASHTVSNVTVQLPFTLVQVTSPTLPATVPSGAQLSIYLSVEAATIGGSYPLVGNLQST